MSASRSRSRCPTDRRASTSAGRRPPTSPRRSASASPRRRSPRRSTASGSTPPRRSSTTRRSSWSPPTPPTAARCCATRPRTCWRRRSSTCSRARSTRSGPRSPTASTTTSNCPTARTSARTTSSASKPHARDRRGRPTVRTRRGRLRRRGSTCSPTSPTSARSSRRVRAGEADADDAGEVGGDEARRVACTATSAHDGDGRRSSTCAAARTCPSTGRLGAFKLTKVAGAYWRGDEKRPMLQRDLRHRVGVGASARRAPAPARGGRAARPPQASAPSSTSSRSPTRSVPASRSSTRRAASSASSWRTTRASGTSRPATSSCTRRTSRSRELFETSGHLDWFADGMFPPMELDGGTDYYLKPMNCPFHILIYRSRTRSYRELPLRLFEFGSVYRYEKSGVVHGLTRVRGMTQDDAHIFCTREQMVEELQLAARRSCSTCCATTASTTSTSNCRPSPRARRSGTDEEWDEATEALRDSGRADGPRARCSTRAAARSTARRSRCRRATRSAAPGRCRRSSSTSRLPQRFDLHYVGADNERHRPIMIHRALFGSVERFFGVLVEHYAGAFPAWLAPVQATVLPVADRHDAYAYRIVDRLRAEGFRAELLDGQRGGARASASAGRRREKVPYILVVGDERRRGGHGRREQAGERTSPSAACRSTTFIERLARRRRRTTLTRRMTLERLWAGWRSRYVSVGRTPDDGCVLCASCAAARRRAIAPRRSCSSAPHHGDRDEPVPVRVGTPARRAAPARSRSRRPERRRVARARGRRPAARGAAR